MPGTTSAMQSPRRLHSSGISVALWGGPGWEPADDWAALVAAGVIAYNGVAILRPALRDLMDATPDGEIVAEIRKVAEFVPDVLAVEKLLVRRSGMAYHVAIHVQASASMALSDSHALGGKVKAAIQRSIPQVERAMSWFTWNRSSIRLMPVLRRRSERRFIDPGLSLRSQSCRS